MKIFPHLWYDKEAAEAVALYAPLFGNSAVLETTKIENTPSGTSEIVTANLSGQKFVLLSAGPFFKPNPSISFLVVCETAEEVDRIWDGLLPDGKVLMELGSYPYSDRYGWIQDKYGMSWQPIRLDKSRILQRITPALMFTGDNCGKAGEAVGFYTTVFRNSRIGEAMRYDKGQEPDREGTIAHIAFTLEGVEFAAMDSARPHDFTFNEAISFIVDCGTQDEIDYYWDKLSARPEAEQCGWLKDKFGVSWQIVPSVLRKMLATPDPEKKKRVSEAFLKMKKFDIAVLNAVFAGK